MKLKSLLFILTIISAVILTISAVKITQAIPPKANLLPSDYATGITYNQALKIKKPMAINFYVDWCGYCKKFAPVLDGLRKEYKGQMNFVIVNVETPEGKKLINQFPISGYPSLYLYNPKNGNRSFVNQAIYSDRKLLKAEIDRFIKFNK